MSEFKPPPIAATTQNSSSPSIFAAILDTILAHPLAGPPLPVEQFSRHLSRAAFELRQRKNGGGQNEENGVGGENGEGEMKPNGGEEAEAIWRRAKLLIQFGLVDDPRLQGWILAMGRAMLNGNCTQNAISDFVDRLEWICLSLNVHNLPSICTPKGAFLPRKESSSVLCANPPFQSSAKAAARVDIAGGWTDTPPITYQMGQIVPAVLSMAIRVNGKLPIRCRCARLEHFQGIFYREMSAGHQQPTLHFPSAAKIFENSNRPSEPGSLICAVLVIAGFVREELSGGARRQFFHFGGPGRGMLIETESDLPHGSGLGSSSILSGALLSALAQIEGRKGGIAAANLVHSILQVEQLHSTGGGWQDQMGGCLAGGAKLGWVDAEGARECRWRAVPLGGGLGEELGERLVLVYTGRTRLAKTLLQEVLLSWARADPDILETVKRLANGAKEAEKMLLQGEFPSKYCAEYNELKKHFAQNTEPQIVGEFKGELMRRGLAEVGWMAGAGGGGFLYIWMAKGARVEQIEEMIEGDARWRGMGIWRVQMEEWGPMEVK